MGRHSSFTPEEKADILQKKLSGMTSRDIARDYYCAYQRINEVLKAQGYRFEKDAGHPYPEQPLEINGLYNPKFKAFIFQ